MKTLVLSILLFLTASTSYASPRQSIKIKADSVLICRSSRSYAYHSFECRGLAHCTHKIIKVTQEEAVRMGYKPCKICYRK